MENPHKLIIKGDVFSLHLSVNSIVYRKQYILLFTVKQIVSQ